MKNYFRFWKANFHASDLPNLVLFPVWLIALIFLVCHPSQAQQTQTVTAPLTISFPIPVPIQTNYYFINPNSLPIVRLTNNVIDPVIGVRQCVEGEVWVSP